jgi:hypothetical protein
VSDTLQVALIVHMNLRPGLPEADADLLWRDCFQPLIGAIHHTPGVKLGLCLAGELVEEFQERHPEGIEWIRGLLERGQIELIGAALHEPVLSAVPERDAIGQLQAHATMIKKVFGVRPSGAWLPHGVWDPAVPRILDRADMKWTLVDDRLISGVMTAGLRVGVPEQAPGAISGVYRAEREGCVVGILPVDARVREVAPDVPVKQIMGHLERRARRGHGLVTVALPASKFTSRRDQSWLATLLVGIAKASPMIETIRPSDAVTAGPSRGRIYLPSGAPREQLVPWERCLLRYEEANRLHKRMIRVSRLVERLDKMLKEGGPGGWRPDPSQLVQANRYLYRAQAAPVYTHSPHPGIYDPRLRALAWRDVLRAEKVCLEAMRIEERISVENSDLDCDGNDDVILRTPSTMIVIDRAHSAGVIEWSISTMSRNLVDTLTRLPEPYHKQLQDAALAAEESPTTVDREDESTDAGVLVGQPSPPGDADDEPTLGGIDRRTLEAAEQAELAKVLTQDVRPRVCFVEHLIGPEVTVQDLQRSNYAELGHGLRDGIWQLVSAERHGEDQVRALLHQDGHIEDLGGDKSVRMQKRYTLHREPMLDFRLEVTNRGHEVLRARLALELDLAPGPGGDALYLVNGGERKAITSLGDSGEVQDLRLEATDLTLHVVLRKPARLWHYPIQTVHQDGARMVLGHQGVCLVLVWPIELWAQEKTRFDARIAVET